MSIVPTRDSKKINAARYVAEAVVGRLRVGERPSDAAAEQLNRQPLIDDLRAVVLESDIPWLLEAMEHETDDLAAFYSSLLRPFSDRSEVQKRLQAMWVTSSPLLRVHLLWRILDDPRLTTRWHQQLFDFVLDQWALFGRICVQFMGNSEDGIRQILHRLGDPSFPESKKWAYLCRLPHLTDQQAAKAILNLGLALPDPFTHSVAELLVGRFVHVPK